MEKDPSKTMTSTKKSGLLHMMEVSKMDKNQALESKKLMTVHIEELSPKVAGLVREDCSVMVATFSTDSSTKDFWWVMLMKVWVTHLSSQTKIVKRKCTVSLRTWKTLLKIFRD